MAVTNAMFIFEVVVESVQSYVESRNLIIRSDFADIFSLELKDPKQMQIVMPEPPPLPPEPPGKGKKKAKPKPKGKKGKKGKEEEPPPEPAIQSGQSVLFTSTAEFLIQNMAKYSMEVSLWSKEDTMVFIGNSVIPWDPIFVTYLTNIANGEVPEPVILKDEYNIFEEGKGKIMAKIQLQVKLSYLGDKVTTAFRTLSEDPSVKKVLYTGINSKTTSYMCTLKTTDQAYEENANKVDNNFIVDKPKPVKIAYADYKNAPGANLTFFNDGDYCCMGHADKPPESIYKAPEKCPDIDFIINYVRKIIMSCNDNMRMLTPRSTIHPRVRATDIDRLCYCKETSWPEGEFAELFKKEAQSQPCPMCIKAGKNRDGRGTTFDIANIRGPCGRPDCKVARDIRGYIENLVNEDNTEFDINELVGPCGSKVCTLAKKIQEFLRHEGVFAEGGNLEGLSTQCACIKKMQDALNGKKSSCQSDCTKDCKESTTSSSNEDNNCDGEACPFRTKPKVYNVYYFTVEHDFNKSPTTSTGTSTPTTKSSAFKFCSANCPSLKAMDITSCSKSACSQRLTDDMVSSDSKCQMPVCPDKSQYPPSPADSDIVINFADIKNPCSVKSCDIAERVKGFIVDGVISKQKKRPPDVDDPCYCDCVCTFKFSSKTTYCAVCGGYECLGDDMRDQPSYIKPHPCPVYHKIYDKKYIKTPNPWPNEETKKPQMDNTSTKSSKTKAGTSDRKLAVSRSVKSLERKSEKKDDSKSKQQQTQPTKAPKQNQEKKKKIGKFTANVEEKPEVKEEPRPETKYPYPPVPKNMGWNWTADDIPGLKPRPNWKPGAANRILVRRYRALREGLDVIAKKKRAMAQRKKKTDFKPTLVVSKRDGEYTVQMEVFKKYSKERLLHQNPYEEKPPLVYTIGKTEEEKRKIQKQRERRERRETRRKSRLLQSTFRDRCQEICLRAYNQAIGLLPLPNPNDPACPCQTVPPGEQTAPPPVDSCSCSDEGTVTTSDTDNDEWTIEFSPPAARYDPKAKHPPILVDSDSQYNYLDYKVKVLDKQGNHVPRFFKGPDGKQECSDLGGFWGPGHVWLEINKDGYIGPDNRWAPMNFIGPDGMNYMAEEGTFTDATGQLLKIGIDGYIDKDGKWVWYPKKRIGARSTKSLTGSTMDTKKPVKPEKPVPPIATKGKGDINVKELVKVNKKDAKGKPSPEQTDKSKKTVSYGTGKAKNPVVMSVSVNYDRNQLTAQNFSQNERVKMSPKKFAKYKEIMQGLEMYEDFQDMKPLMKTNRACNTLRKKTSVCALRGSVLAPIRSEVRSYKTSTTSRSVTPL